MAGSSFVIQVALLVILAIQTLVSGEGVVPLIKDSPCDFQQRENVSDLIKFMLISEELANNLEVDPGLVGDSIAPCLRGELLTGNTWRGWFNSYTGKDRQVAQADSGSGRRKKRSLRRKRAAAWAYFNFPDTQWPLDQAIMFKFDQGIQEHSGIEKDAVRRAFREWERLTCVRFEERLTNELVLQDHVIITKGTGCITFVGKAEILGQPLYLADSCFRKTGILLHEIGHILGMWHETQRPDRDDHVKINYANVLDYEAGNFLKLLPELVDTTNIVYDHSSIMAFHSKAYSKDSKSLVTVETIDPLFQRTHGQRAEIAFNDHKLINTLYCSHKCPQKMQCENSGYQDPNDCNRCRCPDGFTGSSCENVQNQTLYRGKWCGGALMVDDREQELTSPGYYNPGYYDNNLDCVWTLKTRDASKKMLIEIDPDFGIHCSDHQACDHWLEIRHRGKLYELGPRWCCKDLHVSTVTSQGNMVMLIFKAAVTVDEASERRGFRIRFKAIPGSQGSTCGQTCRQGDCVSDQCVCFPGFDGPNCDRDIDECASNPCANDGECVDAENGFVCRCPPGFTGTLCHQAEVECGARGMPAGGTQLACEDPTKMEVIKDMCCRDVVTKYRNGTDRVGLEYYPCNRSVPRTFCHGNAQLFDMGSTRMCAVPGWTPWSACSKPCGACGTETTRQLLVKTEFQNSIPKHILVRESKSRSCNFQACTIYNCQNTAKCRCCECCDHYKNKEGICESDLSRFLPPPSP